jgi:hypothetical protein
VSALRLVTLACDGLLDGPGRSECPRESDAAAVTLREARALAREAGWAVDLPGPATDSRGRQVARDLCPVHRWQDLDPAHYAGDV